MSREHCRICAAARRERERELLRIERLRRIDQVLSAARRARLRAPSGKPSTGPLGTSANNFPGAPRIGSLSLPRTA